VADLIFSDAAASRLRAALTAVADHLDRLRLADLGGGVLGSPTVEAAATEAHDRVVAAIEQLATHTSQTARLVADAMEHFTSADQTLRSTLLDEYEPFEPHKMGEGDSTAPSAPAVPVAPKVLR